MWLPSPCSASRAAVTAVDDCDGVALDARHLHQAADRVAGEAEVVFHGDLGGVLHLLRGAAEHGAEGAGGHGAGRADLGLAAALRAGDRRVRLEQRADRGGGEQEVADARPAMAPGTNRR